MFKLFRQSDLIDSIPEQDKQDISNVLNVPKDEGLGVNVQMEKNYRTNAVWVDEKCVLILRKVCDDEEDFDGYGTVYMEDTNLFAQLCYQAFERIQIIDPECKIAFIGDDTDKFNPRMDTFDNGFGLYKCRITLSYRLEKPKKFLT
jgi:hypothetical protein